MKRPSHLRRQLLSGRRKSGSYGDKNVNHANNTPINVTFAMPAPVERLGPACVCLGGRTSSSGFAASATMAAQSVRPPEFADAANRASCRQSWGSMLGRGGARHLLGRSVGPVPAAEGRAGPMIEWTRFATAGERQHLRFGGAHMDHDFYEWASDAELRAPDGFSEMATAAGVAGTPEPDMLEAGFHQRFRCESGAKRA